MNPDRLAILAFERARLAAPLITAAIVVAAFASEPSGIPLTGGVLMVNGLTVLLGIALTILTRTRLVPTRYGHALAAAVWMLGPINTVFSVAVTGSIGLYAPVLIEIAISAILQINTAWFLSSTLLVCATWLAVSTRELVVLTAPGVVGAAVCGVIMHRLMRQMLIRAETATVELARAQRLEAVGTLSAGLAHDMNNILAGVLGITETIRAGDSTDLRGDAEALIEETQRGARLTRSLLAFGRRGQYQRQPTSMRAIVDDVKQLCGRTLPAQVTVAIAGDADFYADVDRAQITQALINLCTNAAAAMRDTGTVTVAMATHGGRGRISVTDTGHGIDPALRTKIFEPFFTTKPPGQGSGLGLAMVWGSVHGHDGTVEVVSQVGAGTTFRIDLPTVPAPPAPPPVVAPAVRRSGLILVIDDEPLIRKTMARILGRIGCQVITASDGAEAAAIFAERHAEIEIVVLDMSMPVMSGPECFRKLRAIRAVPIIIVSGYTLEANTRELLALGNACFLEKPFKPAQLIAEIDRLLAAAVNYN